jgi:hypothetical protein
LGKSLNGGRIAILAKIAAAIAEVANMYSRIAPIPVANPPHTPIVRRAKAYGPPVTGNAVAISAML